MIHLQKTSTDGNRAGYSFEARIRAAKEARTRVIPEGDLSRFEWSKYPCWREGEGIRHGRQIRRENQSREDLDFGAFSSLLALQPKPSCKSLKKAKRLLVPESDGFSRVMGPYGSYASMKGKTAGKIETFVHQNPFKALDTSQPLWFEFSSFRSKRDGMALGK